MKNKYANIKNTTNTHHSLRITDVALRMIA